MLPNLRLEHVKRVVSKGHEYLYFNTGRKDARGRPIYAKLPKRDDPSFYQSYAAMKGARARGEGDPTLTLPKLIALWEKSPHFNKLSDGTKRVYRIYADVLCDQLATAPAGEVESSDIQLLIDKRADTPGAANMLKAVVASLYKWARERKHVSNDPTKSMEGFELGEHDPWPLDLLEQALAAEDDRVRLATHVLYYTALRIGDACRLRWTDIRDGAIHIVPQKTRKSRGEMVIPIHKALELELSRHRKTLGPILGVQDQTVRKALQAFASKRGHDIVPHGLRKNAVNALLEAGCSVAETAAISGQTMALVEYYAKKRRQAKLGSAAILKWEASGTKTGHANDGKTR